MPSLSALPFLFPDPEDCGTYKPTNVISTSYGYNEADLTPFYGKYPTPLVCGFRILLITAFAEQRQCNECKSSK